MLSFKNELSRVLQGPFLNYNRPSKVSKFWRDDQLT